MPQLTGQRVPSPLHAAAASVGQSVSATEANGVNGALTPEVTDGGGGRRATLVIDEQIGHDYTLLPSSVAGAESMLDELERALEELVHARTGQSDLQQAAGVLDLAAVARAIHLTRGACALAGESRDLGASLFARALAETAKAGVADPHRLGNKGHRPT